MSGGIDGMAVRRVHPAVRGQDPEGGESVPNATISVAKKCRPAPTRLRPKSITPRKPASRKKAESTS